MKCPLKFRLQDITSEKDRIYTGDCLKEECAWWVENANHCSIRCNAESLGQLALTAIIQRKGGESMTESELAKRIRKAVKTIDKLVQTLIKDATAAKNALEELRRLGEKDGEK